MAKKKMGKLYRKWLVILGLVLVVGGLVYVFREALFWRTYRNDEFGFSFKYPISVEDWDLDKK